MIEDEETTQCFELKNLDMFGKKVSLRFEGEEEFKTTCGALATLALAITLITYSIINIQDILKGKISKFDYMIKNRYTEDRSRRSEINSTPDQIIAVALEDIRLSDRSILDIKAVIQLPDRREEKIEIYECTDFVYNRLSQKFSRKVPKNLTILCSKYPNSKINQGAIQKFIVSECREKLIPEPKQPPYPKFPSKTKTNAPKRPLKPKRIRRGRLSKVIDSRDLSPPQQVEISRCASRDDLDILLEEYKVWFFALSDESDFTKPTVQRNGTFSATVSVASNLYKKRNTIVLRDVHLETMKGLMLGQVKKEVTKIFIRHETDILSSMRKVEMLELVIQPDMGSAVYIKRTYQSIFDLIAFVGGLSRGLGILFAVFVYPFREFIYYRKLINSMFSVCATPKQVETAFQLIKDEILTQNVEASKDLDEQIGGEAGKDPPGGGGQNLVSGARAQTPGGVESQGALQAGKRRAKKRNVTFKSISRMIRRQNSKKGRLQSLGVMDEIISAKNEDSDPPSRLGDLAVIVDDDEEDVSSSGEEQPRGYDPHIFEDVVDDDDNIHTVEYSNGLFHSNLRLIKGKDQTFKVKSLGQMKHRLGREELVRLGKTRRRDSNRKNRKDTHKQTSLQKKAEEALNGNRSSSAGQEFGRVDEEPPNSDSESSDSGQVNQSSYQYKDQSGSCSKTEREEGEEEGEEGVGSDDSFSKNSKVNKNSKVVLKVR